MKLKNVKLDYSKKPNNIKNVDVDKILLSWKVSFGKKGFKYLTGYKDNEKVTLLYIILPKMSAYTNTFDETEYMSFLIKNDELLKIWDKVSNSIKGFDSEPAYNVKYLKTIMKSYESKMNTNFHDDGMSKGCFHCVYFSKILTDCVFKVVKNYYSQACLVEYKYIIEETQIKKSINDDLEISSDGSHEEICNVLM